MTQDGKDEGREWPGGGGRQWGRIIKSSRGEVLFIVRGEGEVKVQGLTGKVLDYPPPIIHRRPDKSPASLPVRWMYAALLFTGPAVL